MKKIRYGLIVLSLLLCCVSSVAAQVSIGIGLPSIRIGINLPMFPHLTRVPGYPVYYAPSLDANYFFYDGMYWVYQDDNWYTSTWYNGPWSLVDPEVVPLYILRIPVRYYRQPPPYFRGWQANAPPRWGDHWGRGWEQHRRGWDKWNRRSVPAPAPLPVYQRKFSGARYPQLEQQHTLRSKSYRYQPHDTIVRQHFNQPIQRAQVPDQRMRQETPPARGTRQQDIQRSAPHPQAPPPVVHQQPSQQREPAIRDQRQQPGGAQHEMRQRPQDRDDLQEQNRGHGQGQQNDEDRGRGRNR